MEDGLVEVAGAALRWFGTGAGAPAIVVAHGLASDALAWTDALTAAAAAGHRAVAYDRRGYGGSTAPETYLGTTVEEQAEDLAALLEALKLGPAVLVGDGFGALAVLDVVKRHPALVAAIVVANPPLFQFVPEATEALGRQRAELDAAIRDGGPALAVERWLDGRAAPDALARARESARAFFADFAGLTSWAVTRRELRGLAVPAVLATHPVAPPHLLAAAEALAGLLPDVRRVGDGTPLVDLALELAA